MNTPSTTEVKRRSPEAQRRRRALKHAGHSIADVARLARVSWRMGKYWYDAQKPSPKMAAAHVALTGDDVMARRDRKAS